MARGEDLGFSLGGMPVLGLPFAIRNVIGPIVAEPGPAGCQAEVRRSKEKAASPDTVKRI